MTKMAGRKTGESNPSSVISQAPACTHSASSGEDAEAGRPGDRKRYAGASVCSATELAGNEGGRGAGETPEIPETKCDFVPQDADGELLTPQECPEFRNWGSAASGIPSRSPQEKAHLYTPTDKPAPQGGSTGDGAPLGLEDVRLGWVSIKMPAFRASDLRHIRAVPGPAGRNIYRQRADKRSALFRGGITRESGTGYPHPEWGSDMPDGWGRLTWACACRTRFSPGYHLWGLQPWRDSGELRSRRALLGSWPGDAQGGRWVSGDARRAGE